MLFSMVVNASEFRSFPYQSDVIICPMLTADEAIPDFSAADCTEQKLFEVDPQHNAMWLLLEFELTEAQLPSHTPLGLFVFGKAANRVWLNSTYLGNNGQPDIDKTEMPGKMDFVFYVPDETLFAGKNRLIMQLSGHHSLISLGAPMHLLAFFPYAETGQYVQSFTTPGIALIGAFAVGVIYFLVLSVSRNRGMDHNGEMSGIRHHFPLFAAMCLLAMLQLSAELSRSIINYSYPWQDIRLVSITACSYLFGVLLLVYNSLKVASKHALSWIVTGSLLTLVVVLFIPGFDSKTTAGILLPILINLVQILWYLYKHQNNQLKRWFIGHLLIAVIIFISSSAFHEFVYFLIVALVLSGIFVQQAREYQAQQAELMTERSRSAKLEYRLAQQSQQQTPARLEISSLGKTEFIDSSNITYTKAAGDYVEIHLKDTSEKLYSGTLKQLEELLPDTFLRVHRSYLVNLECVTGLFNQKSEQKSQAFLGLGAEIQVPVSRRLLPSVRDSLKTNNQQSLH